MYCCLLFDHLMLLMSGRMMAGKPPPRGLRPASYAPEAPQLDADLRHLSACGFSSGSLSKVCHDRLVCFLPWSDTCACLGFCSTAVDITYPWHISPAL